MAHTCHAVGCNVSVPPRLLMCIKHWRMVPLAIQRKVWRAYRPGQEIDKRPTDNYFVVAREAIEAVRVREQEGCSDD
jgi:hypothetical protein